MNTPGQADIALHDKRLNRWATREKKDERPSKLGVLEGAFTALVIETSKRRYVDLTYQRYDYR
jgi:hypothetical protein